MYKRQVSRVGGTLLALLRVGGTFWSVSRVGVFLAETVEPRYGGIFSAVLQYGGNVLAVGGFSFFGGNDFGGRWYYQNMAVNRRSTGIAHQGGNFTTGKIPTTTLIFLFPRLL